MGEFSVLGARLVGLEVSASSQDLIAYMRGVEQEIRSSTQIDDLKDDPTFRAYRDFFWRTGIDPTKTRPASEALTRRILRGRELPSINSFVDALNIASVNTKVPFAAFDNDLLVGKLKLRFASPGESILPIGHREPIHLEAKEIVISDDRRLVAVYPHRDSDETKITNSTTTALVLSCGVPGVGFRRIRESLERCCETITRFCGGAVEDV